MSSGTRYKDRGFDQVPQTLYRQLCDHNFSATAIARKLKEAYDAAEREGDTKTMLKILSEVRSWFKLIAKCSSNVIPDLQANQPSTSFIPMSELTAKDYEAFKC